MFKFGKLMLALAHLMAKREAAHQAEKQKQYKKQQDAKAKVLREESDRALAKANALASRAATCKAQATIGCNQINEAERVATSLRASLDYIVAKPVAE